MTKRLTMWQRCQLAALEDDDVAVLNLLGRCDPQWVGFTAGDQLSGVLPKLEELGLVEFGDSADCRVVTARLTPSARDLMSKVPLDVLNALRNMPDD